MTISFKIYNGRNTEQRRMGLSPLVAFEAIRKILGHAAVVPREDLERILSDDWFLAVYAYAVWVREARAVLTRDNQSPVMPVVDLAHLTLRHETCTGGTLIEVLSHGDRIDCLRVTRPDKPLNLASGRDLAIALVGMAAVPDANVNIPHFWSEALGEPSEDAIFGAFLALRAAEFSNDEVVALMEPASLIPDPMAIGQTVLGWAEIIDFDRRKRLYDVAHLFGDTREWIPLPSVPIVPR
jgi:hypothetical protein